jgi:hypothetical protein
VSERKVAAAAAFHVGSVQAETNELRVRSTYYNENSKQYEVMAWESEDSDMDPAPPLSIQGVLEGSPALILADSGANTMIISESYCNDHGIPIYSGNKLGLKYSNSTTEEVSKKTADVRLVVQGLKATVRFHVVKEIAGYDIILGTPFFMKYGAIMDFSQYPRKCTFTKPDAIWLFDDVLGLPELNYFEVVRENRQSHVLRVAKNLQSEVFLIDVQMRLHCKHLVPV